MKRITACCMLAFALLADVHAQCGDSGTEPRSAHPPILYFRIGQSAVDSAYMDNSLALQHLDSILRCKFRASHIDSLHIFSFASPDGNRASNERLAVRRSLSVRDCLLQRYPDLEASRVHLRPQGENRREFRRLIESDSLLPGREEVLRIIDRTPDAESCKARLKALGGGVPYRYISRHILTRLRHASVCMVWMTPETSPLLERVQGGILQDSIPSLSQRQPADVLFNRADITNDPVTATCRRPLLALKTNLLFDLAMVPNIEVEVPLGKRNRWSVNAELMFPWWLFEGDKYCLQVLAGSVEGRYWLGNRHRRPVLAGHFVGLYAGGGMYDLQWDKNGYQGKFYIASGVSYGYACPIGRDLRLEFSIGFGLLRTDYEHYHTLDNYQTLLWQDSGRYTWLGPTKAKISFVWLLNRKVKFIQKGGVR